MKSGAVFQPEKSGKDPYNMRIIFICGCIEPAKDGVGDYTRRLAVELQKNGSETAIISINDPYVIKPGLEHQKAGEIRIPVYRLPSVSFISYARPFAEAFSADIYSLQYVPFAFQPKGLPFGLSRNLRYLNPEAKWHVMFHELWVGIDRESSIKIKLWGRLQKRLITSMLQKLDPDFVHTHITIYKLLLQKAGFKTQQLPLFSNIPEQIPGQVPERIPERIPEHIPEHTSERIPEVSEEIRFVLFATIHPGAPLKIFALDLAKYQEKYRVRIRVTFAGICGPLETLWVRELNANGITTEVKGMQSSENLSHILSHSHFGLTTTPYVQANKSGAVAAMLLHGLPVLCVSRDWSPKGFSPADLKEDGIEKYIPGTVKGSTKGSVEGSGEGSVEGSAKGSGEGSVKGSVEGSVEGSAKGSVEAFITGASKPESKNTAEVIAKNFLSDTHQFLADTHQ
jgi:hypothetical protein